jgi:hypothetical protein
MPDVIDESILLFQELKAGIAIYMVLHAVFCCLLYNILRYQKLLDVV